MNAPALETPCAICGAPLTDTKDMEERGPDVWVHRSPCEGFSLEPTIGAPLVLVAGLLGFFGGILLLEALVSKKSYSHPQMFECVCGAKQLVRQETEIPEEGDDFTGVRTRVRFSDWYAPNKFRSACAMCGRKLHQVLADAPKARDMVFVDGRRVV